MIATPRTVATYAGAQIQDARDHIRIVLTDGKPPHRLLGDLWNAGWKRDGRRGPFVKRNSPTTVFEAQTILRDHGFQEE